MGKDERGSGSEVRGRSNTLENLGDGEEVPGGGVGERVLAGGGGVGAGGLESGGQELDVGVLVRSDLGETEATAGFGQLESVPGPE